MKTQTIFSTPWNFRTNYKIRQLKRNWIRTAWLTKYRYKIAKLWQSVKALQHIERLPKNVNEDPILILNRTRQKFISRIAKFKNTKQQHIFCYSDFFSTTMIFRSSMTADNIQPITGHIQYVTTNQTVFSPSQPYKRDEATVGLSPGTPINDSAEKVISPLH